MHIRVVRAGAEAHPLNSSWLLALLPYLPLLKWQRRDLVHEGATKLRRMKKNTKMHLHLTHTYVP